MCKKILLFVFVFILMCISGCSKNESVSFKVENINNSNIDSNANSWIDTIKDNTGIFIARVNKNKKVDEYYVFAKHVSLGDFGVKSDGLSGLKIYYNINNKIEPINSIYRIQTTNKKAKYIIIDDKKINTKEIYLIP